MSFTSVLSNIGKGIAVALPFLNFGATATAGTAIGNGLTAVAGIASMIESTFAAIGKQNGTGAEKFAAALPYVTGIVTDNLVAGKKIADKDKFNKGCAGILQGVVDVLNSLQA